MAPTLADDMGHIRLGIAELIHKGAYTPAASSIGFRSARWTFSTMANSSEVRSSASTMTIGNLMQTRALRGSPTKKNAHPR